MSWTTTKVARVEMIPEMGGLHVTGLDHVRHCGCRASQGMRMDKQEFTMPCASCAEHSDEVDRVMALMRALPGSDEPVLDMFERLLELEIGEVRERAG